MVEDLPRHRTYFPSLIWSQFQRSRQAVRVKSNRLSDGFFDNVRKINVGRNYFGAVFVKFLYSKENSIVAGARHGNVTAHNPHDNVTYFQTYNFCIASNCWRWLYKSQQGDLEAPRRKARLEDYRVLRKNLLPVVASTLLHPSRFYCYLNSQIIYVIIIVQPLFLMLFLIHNQPKPNL